MSLPTCLDLLSSSTIQEKTKKHRRQWWARRLVIIFCKYKKPDLLLLNAHTHIDRGWCFFPTLVQKQVVIGHKVKDHHYNKLPNSLRMDHILGMFSFLTSLPTSHFLNFLKETFAIHKLFVI
jgi:hypothetical protein